MKSFIILITLLLVFNIKSEYLSKEYFQHQQDLVDKINNLHTTWKAEVYPVNVKPLLGVLIDPDTKTFTKERLSIPARNITPIKDLPENFDLRINRISLLQFFIRNQRSSKLWFLLGCSFSRDYE